MHQLTDPATRQVVWLALGLATLALGGLWTAVGYLLAHTAVFDAGWIETAVDLLGGLATLVLTWLLFPAVVSGVIAVALDALVTAVERRHYPDLPTASGLTLGEELAAAGIFLLVKVVVNLMLLPFLLLGPVFPFVFVAANGYLLGREYFELVALRRLPREEARALRKSRSWSVTAAGSLLALMMAIPVVNLVAPVIGAAAMVHLFETWRRARASEPTLAKG
ncbi:MAG: EI24 domain-containing protein [Magnetospirillum sp. WYHS-4]